MKLKFNLEPKRVTSELTLRVSVDLYYLYRNTKTLQSING